MIESNIIEWLNFGDSIQAIDIYSNSKKIFFFRFFRALTDNKHFPIFLYIILIIIYFIQLWTLSIMFVKSDDDIILEILNYLKNITIFSSIIKNESIYKLIIIIIFCIIIINTILIIISLVTFKILNTSFLIFIINFLNILIYYYIIGPTIEVSLTSIWCENKIHKYLQVNCYSNPTHLLFLGISLVILLLSIFISFIYSFYCNRIGIISINIKESIIRINCNYETFCLATKIIIFALYFFLKISGDKLVYKLIYEGYITVNCLIMSIYTYKNVYYYNNIINGINHFGWFISVWISFCIFIKSSLNIHGISILIIVGTCFIAIAFYNLYTTNEKSLMTDENIFEFKNIKLIEIYKNILLNEIKNIDNKDSKILIFGIIKKFEEFIINNQEIIYNYHKILNDKYLSKKFNQEYQIPVYSILYILYSFYLGKSSKKQELTFYMCYFLINKFKNITYAILLLSKLKTENHKDLYYKYLLTEDIKEYLTLKLNRNNLNKESIKHIQIGSIILYYFYIDLFKIKIFEAIRNQIDYLDLLYDNTLKNKICENFLKYGKNILKYRKQIIFIWRKIVELNPFSEECKKDYILYLETIIQDEYLSKEESKKYKFNKNNKLIEKNNIYHRMFLFDTSSILLVDGYLSIGKILYSSQNFSFLFSYNEKEILNMNIEDLLPNCIQIFHKELIDEAIKYSNINNIFKIPKDSLLKNKNGRLFNIKLFIKPVPNLSYGLVYFNYIQKIHDQNFIIVLDKNLKVNGFTDVDLTNSSFTMNNGFNLGSEIIGIHIGLIIPNILFLLEYENEEFIIKKDNEMKGILYSIGKIKNIKNRIDFILEKIKNNIINENNIKGHFENNLQDMAIDEFNELIKEYNHQNIKSFNIYFKIKLYSFLYGKFRYYRVYINSDNIKDNDYTSLINKSKIEKIDENINFYNINNLQKKSKIIKLKLINNNSNNNDINKLNENIKNNNKIIDKKSEDIENKEESKKNNEKLMNLNNQSSNRFEQIDSNKINNSKEFIKSNEFNKIKNDIINKKIIFPIKLMKYLYYIFDIIIIVFMIIDLLQQKSVFNKLSLFLEENLYFNQTKIKIGIFHLVCVSFKWLSHSLYINNNKCPTSSWKRYYEVAFTENIDVLKNQKNKIHYLSEDFKDILNKKHQIELYIYKFKEKEKYDFNLDNILTFIFNSAIKIVNEFSYFTNISGCKEIQKELGFNEVYLQNLIDQTFFLFNSNISGYIGEEKEKKINKNFYAFPFPLIISGFTLILILFIYIYIIFYICIILKYYF